MLSIVFPPKNRYALPVTELLANAPTITSANPSAFTSPASETEYPKRSPTSSPSSVTSTIESIGAPPKYTYAYPAFVDK